MTAGKITTLDRFNPPLFRFQDRIQAQVPAEGLTEAGRNDEIEAKD